LNRLFWGANNLSAWGGVGSALCTVAIVILILAEILMKILVGRSTFITEEYAGYLLCWFAFLGMGYTLKSDGHIRVNILLSRLGTKGKIVFDIFGALIGMATFAYLTIFLFLLFYDSLISGVKSMHFSETPLFVPQSVAVLGSFIMFIQFGALIWDRLGTLRQV
jgi:TRAP-type transport system small permease protein